MNKYRIYRRELVRTGHTRYMWVDDHEATNLALVIDYYERTYLHDERAGTEILFIDPDGSIASVYVVQRPAPPVSLVGLELVKQQHKR